MKISKKILLIFISLILLLGSVGGVLSEEGESEFPSPPKFTPQDYLHGTGSLNLPKGEMEPAQLIVAFINYLLTFLSIIGVIILIIGGLTWATAGGNEEKVNKAKKTILAAVIGLAVVLLAWVIVKYVITMIQGVIGG